MLRAPSLSPTQRSSKFSLPLLCLRSRQCCFLQSLSTHATTPLGGLGIFPRWIRGFSLKSAEQPFLYKENAHRVPWKDSFLLSI